MAGPEARRRTAQSPLELGRAPDAPTVTYQALEGGWWLWWPCAICRGIALPLREREGAERVGRDQPCPGCESHRKRLEPAAAEPEVWYDALLEDWVVRVPCRGSRSGALLPMELRWFDTPWAEVIRTAADIAYGVER